MFFTGKRSNEPDHPDYVPSVFPAKDTRSSPDNTSINGFERAKRRENLKYSSSIVKKLKITSNVQDGAQSEMTKVLHGDILIDVEEEAVENSQPNINALVMSAR